MLYLWFCISIILCITIISAMDVDNFCEAHKAYHYTYLTALFILLIDYFLLSILPKEGMHKRQSLYKVL